MYYLAQLPPAREVVMACLNLWVIIISFKDPIPIPKQLLLPFHADNLPLHNHTITIPSSIKPAFVII